LYVNVILDARWLFGLSNFGGHYLLTQALKRLGLLNLLNAQPGNWEWSGWRNALQCCQVADIFISSLLQFLSWFIINFFFLFFSYGCVVIMSFGCIRNFDWWNVFKALTLVRLFELLLIRGGKRNMASLLSDLRQVGPAAQAPRRHLDYRWLAQSNRILRTVRPIFSFCCLKN